jgi:hypothetical protein
LIKLGVDRILAGRRRRGIEKNFRTSGGIWRFLAAGVFLAGLWPSLAEAEMESERIERVKAAFVLNIARFVSWPDEALEPRHGQLLLCLYRDGSLAAAVETIEGKMVNGRALQTSLVDSLAHSRTCNILLIGASEMQRFEEESRHAPDRPLLTIGDLTDAAPPPPHRQALITLVRNGARIGFEINLAKARRAGLQMSSNLLKLAKIVGEGT